MYGVRSLARLSKKQGLCCTGANVRNRSMVNPQIPEQPMSRLRQSIKLPVGNAVLSVEWVTYDDRAWLAPLWIVSPDGKTRRPVRLIAPRPAPGIKPIPGPEILKIFAQIPLSQALLEQGEIPPELGQLVEVLEAPDISFPTPEALN